MKRLFFRLTAVFFIAAGSFITSCTAPASTEKIEGKTETSTFSVDSVKASIAASNKLYGECFATGDSAKFASCYTSDACISPSNVPKMCGAQAINSFFNGAYKMGIRNIQLTTGEVFGGKDAVVETGTYQLMVDKGQVVDKGKYIVVWKEENGQWKMYRDIWNTDIPVVQPSGK